MLAAFVAKRYAFLDVKHTDWDRVTRYYSGEYAKAETKRARLGVLEAMLDELYDPHSHLTANYKDSWRLPAFDIWASARDGHYIVDAVRLRSPAERAGVRAGMEVLAINGVRVSDSVAARRPRFLRSPDPSADEWALLSVLSGRHNELRELELRDAAGQISTIAIPNTQSDDAPPALSSSTIDRIPYISISTFAQNDVVPAFDRALEMARNSPTLIIDVRNNGGGDTAIMRPIMGRFLTERKQFAWMARRDGARLGQRWPEYVDPRGPWTFRGKVVVLADRWSESVAESFAMGMNEICGATVVGTEMAGLGAAVAKIHLQESNIDAQISAEPVYALDGASRSAFKPTILVDLTKAAGPDPILSAGLAAARDR